MIKQTEYDWAYLYGAVNPRSGESVCIVAPTVNTAWMSRYLLEISTAVGPARRVVLVMDRAGWHISKDLEVPANIDLLLLPPYSPELNPVERLWLYLKSHYLSNRLYADYDHLVEAGGDAVLALTPAIIRSVCAVHWVSRTN
jgi:transposase